VSVALARTAAGVRSTCLLVRFREIEIGAVVPVMVPYPIAQVETGAGFVATLGRQIQAHVGSVCNLGITDWMLYLNYP
jgi:hypothetical protein